MEKWIVLTVLLRDRYLDGWLRRNHVVFRQLVLNWFEKYYQVLIPFDFAEGIFRYISIY